MKVRLRVVEKKLHTNLRENCRSTRKYEVMKSWNVASDVCLTGQTVTIRGTEYFVLEQLPAQKALNAAKKSLDKKGFQKWMTGLRAY